MEKLLVAVGLIAAVSYLVYRWSTASPMVHPKFVEALKMREELRKSFDGSQCVAGQADSPSIAAATKLPGSSSRLVFGALQGRVHWDPDTFDDDASEVLGQFGIR